MAKTRKVPEKAEIPQELKESINETVEAVKEQPVIKVPEEPTNLSSTATHVKIPTRGIFYENGVDTFILRPMTVAEEEIMTTIRLVRTGEALDRILQNCIEYPKMRVKDLKLADTSYLIVALRQLSYGNKYPFNLQCPSCGEPYNDELDLSELPFTFIPEGTTEEDLVVELPQSGKTINFRLLNGHDEQKINQKKKDRVKYSNVRDMYNGSYTDRLMLSIVAVDNERLDEKPLHDFIRSLTVIDSEALRDKIEEYSAGIDIEIETDCPYCNHYDTLMMPLDVNFFRHSRKRDKKRRRR